MKGIEEHYEKSYPLEALKLLAKGAAFSTGDNRYADVMSPNQGTSTLDSAAMDEFINIMEATFSLYWPDAYIPARFDETWGEGK